MLARDTRILLLVVTLVALSACSAQLGPRTSQPLKWRAWAKAGAVIDASRAHPVAFWIDGASTPETVAVDGESFAARQWLLHLSLRLNEAVKTKTLYDGRFAAVGPTLFRWRLVNGRYKYEHVGQSEDNLDIVVRSGARVAQIKFVKLTHQIKAGQFVYELTAELQVGLSKLVLSGEAEGREHWDARVIDDLGTNILASGQFWQAVAMM